MSILSCSRRMTDILSPGGERQCASGTQRREVLLLDHFRGHNRVVNSVMFSLLMVNTLRLRLMGTRQFSSWMRRTDLQSFMGQFGGHAKDVNSVAFSPDSKFIASGSDDEDAICIWHANTGTLAYGPIQGHTDCVNSVAFSPDGRRVVSGSHDQTIRIWDVVTGAIVAGPFRHNGLVLSATSSPDGKHIVSSLNPSTIHIWDMKTGSSVSQWHNDGVAYPLHTPKMANTSFQVQSDSTISISGMRIPEHKFLGHFEGTPMKSLLLHFSLDGKRAVSGSHDGTIRTWDVESSGSATGPHKGESHTIHSVAFSPDGKHHVSGSDDGALRIWDVETGALACKPVPSARRSHPHLSHSRVMVNTCRLGFIRRNNLRLGCGDRCNYFWAFPRSYLSGAIRRILAGRYTRRFRIS